MVTKLWRFLNTDISELDWKPAVEITKAGAESAKAVFDLAKTVNEKKADVGTLKPLVEGISSLLDALNSPLGQIAKDAIPFAPIAVTILSLIADATKKDPTLEQCVALVVQAAYLESLRSLLTEDPDLLARVGDGQVSESVSKQIQRLGELEINDLDARKALLFFHESDVAKAFSAVLEARLLEAGLKTTEVRATSERVARRTNDYIQTVLAELGEKVNPLVTWYSSGGQGKFEQYLSIEAYLRDVISPESTNPILRDRWRVFNEKFTLKEIYVPLKVQFIGKNGEPEKHRGSVVLDSLAKAWLNNPDNSRVLFIQGHPGRGKSVFCRMFAEWVRQNEHPNWTPILIRLRDVRSLEKAFEETLRKAVDWDFALSDEGWLSDRNTRFLFLLDGFDELLMEGRTSGGLEDFLEQVEKFQRSCQTNSEKGHRVLITGRTLALQSIERKMPSNLDRVELLEMEDDLQAQWFVKWSELFGSEKTNAFQQFLQNKQCPDRVEKLAREPLLLYLLAAMHRDEELDLSLFEEAEGAQAKVRIYQKTIDWVLTKQREADLNRELTEMEIEDLRTILAEAGLCVVQSGGECASIKMIEARLKDNSNVQNLLEEARQKLQDNPLRNALAAFYLQPGSLKGEGGSVEFIHKSFGEFLCAERLKNAIESWTEPGRRRERFYVPTDQLNREIYDLLGSPVLTPEIVEYLMALLKQCEDEFKPVELFERLHEFYERWCDGGFIDELPDKNLPQQKMRSLREQLPNQENALGLRQVDVYAGLNVMILLLELHRYAQAKDELKEAIVFYPSGKLVVEDEYIDRLLKIISYSDCVELRAFSSIVGSFLIRANLYSAILIRANLSSADLTGADLDNTDLSSADLSSAILTSADLIGSNLHSADLTGSNLASVNLSSANLIRANLTNANLTNANLYSVNLTNANLYSANLTNANLTGTHLASAILANANLTSADLTGSNLDSANLIRANLTGSNLASAYLVNANLASANLQFADLENISWDEQTKWEGVKGLETAENVPEALKKQLGLE